MAKFQIDVNYVLHGNVILFLSQCTGDLNTSLRDC